MARAQERRALSPPSPNAPFLIAHPGRNYRHRLGKFVAWLDETRQLWQQADLAHYRDYLLHECRLAPSSVSTHLATLRSRYQDLLADNTLRETLFQSLAGENGALAFADRKALVDEAILRIQNNTNPRRARVSQQTRQDRSDDEHLRLSAGPGAFATGGAAGRALPEPRPPARRARYGHHRLHALHRPARGAKSATCASMTSTSSWPAWKPAASAMARAINSASSLMARSSGGWTRWIAWLEEARIEQGYVFRGFYKGNRLLRRGRLNETSILRLLRQYPVLLRDRPVIARPHDLRRTYARRLYEAGMKLEAIQQNLGHERAETTRGYIGQLGVAQRCRGPPLTNCIPERHAAAGIAQSSALDSGASRIQEGRHAGYPAHPGH